MKEVNNNMLKLGRFNSIILDRELSFAYISIPKAANSSIKDSLSTMHLQKEISANERAEARRLLHKQKDGIFEFCKKDDLIRSRPGFVFSAVRNTWDRIHSCYKNKVANSFHEPFSVYGMTKGMDFEKFLETICEIPDREAEIHFRSQLGLLTHKGQFLPDLVLRSERLDRQWDFVRAYFENAHQIELSKIGRLNVSPKQRSSYKFSKRSVDLIEKRYAKEISFFGFEPPHN